MKDSQRVHVELVEAQRLLNRVAAVVHERLGLQQQHSLAADPAFGDEAAELLLPRAEIMRLGDHVSRHEADVVPVECIFRTGIPEADPKLHGASLA